MAADKPDRNLRFILGHAFTLDKIRLQIAQIEEDSSDDENEVPTEGRERRVSFRGNSPRPAAADRKRSPPPDQFAHLKDTDSDSSEEEEELEDEEEDSGLSLRRFESGSARPPQMVDDDGSSSEEDEPRSPPPLTEEELKTLTGGESNTDLAEAYNHVVGCPCHGHVDAPKVEKMWEVPQKQGYQGGRVAVVQVAS
jgi:hypothetical protein